MKKSFLTTVSIVALVAATAASAADLPVKAKPVAPAALPWSWSGGYVGLNLGAGKPRTSFTDIDVPDSGTFGFSPPGEFAKLDNWGFTLGGQAGYNWQVGNLVAGVEADINWLDGKSTASLTSQSGGAVGTGIPLFIATNTNGFGTARGRLGVTFSHALIYATGGVAVARLSNDYGAVNRTPSFSYHDTRSTWVVGGGVEYMLTQHWTVKIEGLYADFGTSPIQTITGFSGNYQSKFTNSLTVIRGGVNWKW
jgi:outer membrane immunogenic protein